MNWTILKKVWCMLLNIRLDKDFWAEAIVYACYLINSLSSVAIQGQTPLEMWIDKPTFDYDSLYISHFTTHYHVKKKKI